ISHLAAKSVSAYVVYNLQKSVSSLLICLFCIINSLTFSNHLLCALCSKFLPDEREEVTQCPVDFTSSSHWGTTCCLLLDLLEALTASSLICDAGLKSQRLTHIHSSALLTTVRCSSQYFVKKRAMLLLKRAVLQKAGEDWALGDVPSTGLKYEHFSSDMNTLAETVLTAVVANWLETVQVESASFFGGTRNIQGDDGQKPDSVMLRAVSLLLLKSMEKLVFVRLSYVFICISSKQTCHVNLKVFHDCYQIFFLYLQCVLICFRSNCMMIVSVLMCTRGFLKGSETMCE
uniref:Protein Lines N-terminal domain-containing protein n=1 Tax=Seriola lalandi dorsalis TaxID=1841481 RepID=A0A3B4YLS4_SERLL